MRGWPRGLGLQRQNLGRVGVCSHESKRGPLPPSAAGGKMSFSCWGGVAVVLLWHVPWLDSPLLRWGWPPVWAQKRGCVGRAGKCCRKVELGSAQEILTSYGSSCANRPGYSPWKSTYRSVLICGSYKRDNARVWGAPGGLSMFVKCSMERDRVQKH